jgi:hypothetical protein
MKCPVHEEDILDEWGPEGRLGFCQKCFKKYRRCSEVQHMNSCNLAEGHKGPHMDSKNNQLV